jgi:hypothetical protein
MGARLEERVVGGRTVWVEADRPDDCPSGHGRIGAAWWPCETCGTPCRHWPCGECGWRKVDPEHECRDLVPSSAMRGG